MYLYNPHTIGKFLQVAVHRFPKTADEVLQDLTSVLENLFLARIANATLRMGLSSISFLRHCSITRQGLIFDFNEYVRNYLASNGRLRDMGLFMEEIDRHRPNLRADARLQIQGHDFIELFAWYIGKHRPALRQTFDAKTVERALFTSVEHHELAQEGLFRRLNARLEA
jgi:hypothetical protein